MGAYVRAYLRRPAAGIFSTAMILLALPAEAHHPGGGGNTGSGGPINTISADTLAEGMMAASIRYEFIRLGQLNDADLLAAANRGVHAHSMRSIDKRARCDVSPESSPFRSALSSASTTSALPTSSISCCGCSASARRAPAMGAWGA